MSIAPLVFVDATDLPAPLVAACLVALGDPTYMRWMSDEVEKVRATIDAYEAACSEGEGGGDGHGS